MSFRPLAIKLLDLVSEMSLESSPILFHCFSNSGATVYQYMAEEMRNNKQYEGMMDKVIGEISITFSLRRVLHKKGRVIDIIDPRLLAAIKTILWSAWVLTAEKHCHGANCRA